MRSVFDRAGLDRPRHGARIGVRGYDVAGIGLLFLGEKIQYVDTTQPWHFEIEQHGAGTRRIGIQYRFCDFAFRLSTTN